MVAPIIATLLLVGISVVGGIAVFFWASGAYSVSTMPVPRAEVVQLVGYDARDTDNIGGFDDDGANIDNDPTIGSLSTEAGTEEFMVLELRNAGSTPILIDRVSIIGTAHTFDSDSPGVTDQPSPGTFEVYANRVGNTSSKGSPVIEPSEDARLAVRLSSSIPAHIELGEKLIVKISTQEGTVINTVVTVGDAE